MVSWGFLGDPPSENKGIRGMKIGITNKRKISDLGEGSYQTHLTISGASGHGQFDERDEELERLRRLVRDLELEARGGHQRMDRDD